MTKIAELAAKIRLENKQVIEAQDAKYKKEREAEILNLLTEFEEGFKNEIPMLKEAGITYSAHFNTVYAHQGAYILFKHGLKELRMDFNNRISFRYEYTPWIRGLSERVMGRCVYGDWPKDEFILFIDEGLIQQKTENQL